MAGRTDAAYMRRWRAANPEREKAIKKRWREKARRECLAYYGGDPPACACCGESIFQFLCLDHVNGGGNDFRRSQSHGRGAGPLLYAALRKQGYPSGWRVLCWNCNAATGLYGECPHLSH